MKYIGLGTAALGRPSYINIRSSSTNETFDIDTFKAEGVEVLDTAYEAGVRYYDTAPGYGLAEQLLIGWVHEKKDESIKIATKWGYTYVANFNPNAQVHELKEHSLSKLNEQWEKSKELLPYLKVYQIHSAQLDTGVLDNKAVLERLAELKEEHHIAIGITSSGENQAEAITKAMSTEINGAPLFSHYQVTHNLLDSCLATLLEDMRGHGIKVIIKEAMANGRIFPNDNYPHYKSLYTTLIKLANKYKVGIDAISLRYCQDTIRPYKILSGANNVLHLKSNLQVNNFQLERNEIDELKQFNISATDYWNERKRLGWN